jgi:hypothetical protein
VGLYQLKKATISALIVAIMLFTMFPSYSKAEESSDNPVIQIAAGSFHKLALRKDGTVVAWGADFLDRVALPEMRNVQMIAAGHNYSVFVYKDGTVSTWGASEREIPKNPPKKLTDIVQISAGYRHVLALKKDGTVVSWGEGEGAAVPENLKNIVAVAAGYDHSLALDNNGKVYAWGEKDGRSSVPSTLGPVKAIAEGGTFCVALQKDGKVVIWGLDTKFEPSAPLTNVVSIAAARGYVLALRADGKVVYVGYPAYLYVHNPEFMNQLTGVKQIATGMYDDVALLENGKVVNWGKDVKPYNVPDGIRQPGIDATLNGIAVSGKNNYSSYANYSFQENQKNYHLDVPYGLQEILLEPRTEDPHVSEVLIRTNKSKQTGTSTIDLGNGPTYVSVKVTAEDQKTSKTYALNVYQTLNNRPAIISNVPLSDGVTGNRFEVNSSEVLNLLNTPDELDKLKIIISNFSYFNRNTDIVIPSSVIKAIQEKDEKAQIEICDPEFSTRFPVSTFAVDQIIQQENISLEDLSFIVQLRLKEMPLFLQSEGFSNLSPVYRFNVVAKAGSELKSLILKGKVESTFGAEVIKAKAMAAQLDGQNLGPALPIIPEIDKVTIKHRWNQPFFYGENNNNTFKDIGGLWNEEQVKKLAARGIVKGKKDGTFGPHEPVSRIQFAVMLTRALGLYSESEYRQQFSDVSGKEWFVPELLSAVEAGIIKGKNDGTFAPNDPITREQAAAMLGRAMRAVGYEPLKLDETKNVDNFRDVQQITWAREDVNLLLQANVLSGKADGSFAPRSYTTRSQMVKLLDQFLVFTEYGN